MGARLGRLALLGELPELGARILVGAGAELFELCFERGGLLERRVAARGSGAERLQLVFELVTAAVTASSCACSSSSRFAAAACNWLSSAPRRS